MKPLPWSSRHPTLFTLLVILAVATLCVFSAQAFSQQIPKLPLPLNTPITPARVDLGKKLVFDPRLSQPVNVGGQLLHTISCATCHDPSKGWADHNPLAIGILGRVGTRNSPTLINAAYNPLMFHDGRTNGTDGTGPGALASQCLLPIVNRDEMGNQTEQQVLNRLRSVPGYVALFQNAYGPGQGGRSPIDRSRYGHAISSFISTLVSFDAPIDRRMAGDVNALSPRAEIGFAIFRQANCMSCHTPPLYTDRRFHNNGFEFATKQVPTDRGRAAIVTNNRNTTLERAFKTPSLREIQRTFPYGHNGAFPNLEAVVRHYNLGGAQVKNGQLVVDRIRDPLVRPLNLTSAQEAYLVTFLQEAFASPNYPFMYPPQLPK